MPNFKFVSKSAQFGQNFTPTTPTTSSLFHADNSLFKETKAENSKLKDDLTQLQQENKSIQEQLQTNDVKQEQLQTSLDQANIRVHILFLRYHLH